MDKLKENGFALGLGGLGVLFLALAWFMIFQPVFGDAGINSNAKGLSSQKKNLDNLLGRKVLPTPQYADKVEDREEEDLETYESAIKGFDDRCKAFQNFFDGTTDQPSESQFSSLYRDGIKSLKQAYLAEHPVIVETVDEEARGDLSKLPPVVDLKKDSELADEPDKQLPLAMKQYWMAESVFRACGVNNGHVVNKLGGLKSIEFPEPRETRRKKGSSKSKDDDEEETQAAYTISSEEVLCEIKIEMPYGEFEGFLMRLLSDSKVPFIEPKSVKMVATKLADEENSPFKALVHKVSYPNKAAAASAETAGEPKIPEPPVEFTVRLAALDWGGVTRAADEQGDDDDDDFDDDDFDE